MKNSSDTRVYLPAQLKHEGELNTHLPPYSRAISLAVMSQKNFEVLGSFIHSACGIRMPPSKKTMLEGRLRRRLRDLGMPSFDQYCDYLFKKGGVEREFTQMIDLATTNKTDFLREPEHFEYLTRVALPELVHKHGLGIDSKLNVWSAGCSTGEEPYTLAMILSDFASSCPGFRFSILATDISSRALEEAKQGIYRHERVEALPLRLRKKYLLKSKDGSRVKIAPELRSVVTFRRLNLMDEDFGMHEKKAVIFFRNVMIYFDKATQQEVVNRLCRCLKRGGFLFTGHSETLQGLGDPSLVCTSSSVYRKPGS